MSNNFYYSDKVVVNRAIVADAEELFPDIRPADLRELSALHPDPEHALKQSVMVTDTCWCAKEAESAKPICIFGVKPVGNFGVVWLMASTRLDRQKWLFLRESREWLKRLEAGHEALGNFVHADNTLHIRWLRWLGFTFLARHNGIGRNGEDFYEFAKICSRS